MDGYDVEQPNMDKFHNTNMSPTYLNMQRFRRMNTAYRVYQIEKPKVGKPVKIYRFGYPDYKSMIQKHPELKVLQLTR